MSVEFKYHVFLSHSSKDKAVVRPLAERLKADGLKVWYDEWEIAPGDSIPAKIEEGLEGSRVLVLCMSANAFGSDWARLESYTFRFRDPLNKERRFIPLRLDDAPIKGSLAQFLYIQWGPEDREKEYPRLLKACQADGEMGSLPAPAPESKKTDEALVQPAAAPHSSVPSAHPTGEVRPDKNPGTPLSKGEVNKLVNRYIGVSAGYLGDFTYRTHRDFYLDLDLNIDPDDYDGTTRERFIKILSESQPDAQARILEGILDRFQVGSTEHRTQELHDQIAGWISRLNG